MTLPQNVSFCFAWISYSYYPRLNPESLSVATFFSWACGISSAPSPSHLSLLTTLHCIRGESCSLQCAMPVGSHVTHPDLGHLLTRSQRSATPRLKQLHPSSEFPLWAAIIIADRHAKKLKWICSAQAVTFQQTAVIFRSLCLLRWEVVIVSPPFSF